MQVERRRLFWQAVKAALGLGPRRDISPEARLRRAHWRALIAIDDCPEDPDF